MPRKPLRKYQEDELAIELGISIETLGRLIEGREFPDRIWVTERTGYWVQEDIDAYLYLRGRIGPKKNAEAVPRKRGSQGGQEGVTGGS